MKNQLTTLLICAFCLNLIVKGQCQQIPSIEEIKGIWQFIPNNKGDSLLLSNYILFNKNKSIDITYWRKTKKANNYGTPFSYFGFYDGENRGYPKQLADLDNSGHHIFFYDDLGRDYDSLGNLFLYRTCGVSYNEDEAPDHEPAILRFYYKGIPDVFIRVKAIPDSILLALKRNPEAWKYYAAFVGMIQKKVRAKQATLYQSPTIPFKAYLVAGDEVQILQNKKDWYRIRYYGKKVIEGWVRRIDVD